jgi:hypothetical protein
MSTLNYFVYREMSSDRCASTVQQFMVGEGPPGAAEIVPASTGPLSVSFSNFACSGKTPC